MSGGEGVLPITVAEWERNSREVVRVGLEHYNGRDTINVRVWYRDDDDMLKPGKTGITLALKHLPAMAAGLAAAMAKAEELGLLREPKSEGA